MASNCASVRLTGRPDSRIACSKAALVQTGAATALLLGAAAPPAPDDPNQAQEIIVTQQQEIAIMQLAIEQSPDAGRR